MTNQHPTKQEMETALLANGWHQNMWNSTWGNTEEPGFWNLEQAFKEIDRINSIRHDRTKSWKFIPDHGV